MEEYSSPAGSPFLRSAASWAELLRTTKNPGPAVLLHTLRRCSCQGPERHFLCYYTFPDCRILKFGADHSAADSGAGRSAFSNVRAWPPGGEHLRADTWAAVSRSTVPARVRFAVVPGSPHGPERARRGCRPDPCRCPRPAATAGAGVARCTRTLSAEASTGPESFTRTRIGAGRSADPHRFRSTWKLMQPTDARVFQNWSTTQIPGVHHDHNYRARHPGRGGGRRRGQRFVE